MSKGSSYWGTATGKVGNLVISVVKGQRVERAYQPNVTNPRTNKQVLQRARFACAVSFYKRARAQFFNFAYEDKKQTESDYNAFMRWNTNDRAAWLLKSQVEGTYPAIGNNWVISAGSLDSPEYVSGSNACYYVSIPSLDATADTVAVLSNALISDYSLQEGDILTIVRVSSTVKTLTQANPANPPKWEVKQLILSTTDNTELANIDSHISLVSGEGLYLDNVNHSTAYWYGVVFSRKTTGGLLVSTSYLRGNATAINLYTEATSAAWKAKVLTSWGASGEAILEGALATASVAAVIETCAGDAIPRVSETVFDTGITSTAILTGKGLSALTVSDFSGIGVRVSGLTIQDDTTAIITLTGTGEHPYSWVLQYGRSVIAQHSDVVATINSVTPANIEKLDAGDTVTITISGQYVDVITASDLVSSTDALQVTSVAAVTSAQTKVTLSAKTSVTEGTISYNSKVIFQVAKVVPVITSTSPSSGGVGAFTLTLTGTGLTALNTGSFTKPSDWVLTSYTANDDGTSATIVGSAPTVGTMAYSGSTIYTVKSGSDDD